MQPFPAYGRKPPEPTLADKLRGMAIVTGGFALLVAGAVAVAKYEGVYKEKQAQAKQERDQVAAWEEYRYLRARGHTAKRAREIVIDGYGPGALRGKPPRKSRS